MAAIVGKIVDGNDIKIVDLGAVSPEVKEKLEAADANDKQYED